MAANALQRQPGMTQPVDHLRQIAGLRHQLVRDSLAPGELKIEGRRMRYVIIAGLAIVVACQPAGPTERYGFITRLGTDTISAESVTRRGNKVTSDEVDRFPRVRHRHTEIELAPNGAIRSLVMDIVTPSEEPKQRQRRVTVTVTDDSVHIMKRDSSGAVRREFATGGGIAMAHLPQMYSLYELYFAAALGAMAAKPAGGDTANLRQFYIDREFDKFPLHTGRVWRTKDGKLKISHDWLAGIGEATVDSGRHLLSYSGAGTTYKVEVARVAEPPDVQAIGRQLAAAETKSGFTQLSVRDTARATIGGATLSVDYGRPLARGRELLGKLLPYDYVWRTGANAATQLTTSAPITLAGVRVPAGTYSLWTVPRPKRADIVVNAQSGQWGTEYDGKRDVGMGPMTLDSLTTPVEKFSISITGSDARHGVLTMAWGSFRWTAPIVVLDAAAGSRGQVR
ncbi:MAG TPA: DUF2911 domain-containing protein [Gemmatimonadaceae bacterium]|nr:DUF2911 domain-containing protein [Gemmatimonadaceae bacterium]